MSPHDAVIVGSGPNGLTAAAHLARAGKKVLVLEASDEVGGGTRTADLTLPGFSHDVCSAIHPSGVVSPAFKALDLEVDWITPPVAVAHPLPDGRAAGLFNTIEETADGLPGADGATWTDVVAPIAEDLESVVATFLAGRILPNPAKRSHRVMVLLGTRGASALAGKFESTEARALVAGLAAHSVAPLDALFTSGVALLFGAIGNTTGWPLVRGGSVGITNALVSSIIENGGEIATGQRVSSLEDYEDAAVFLDLSPWRAREVGRLRMNPADIVSLGRWRPGPGVFKIDYALDGPVPWSDPISSQAGTVHVGGTFEEISDAEKDVAEGRHPDRPFVLFAQQSDFDPSRAPDGKRTGWAYCHVPNGSDVDMTERIESQIERFAPGFRDLVLERFTRDSAGFERYNPNNVGGDISGGAFRIKRFVPKLKSSYKVGRDLYICSAATPPGGGVHGLCGWHAAEAAMG